MSNEMIERVENAIHDKCDVDWTTAKEAAKAAIEAMRELTEEMVSIGETSFFDNDNVEVKQCWYKMIDAALKED